MTSCDDPEDYPLSPRDGRTHLAHKAEHAVDLESGALLAVTVQPADRGDTTSIFETLDEAEVMGLRADLPPMKAWGLDKGYHGLPQHGRAGPAA